MRRRRRDLDPLPVICPKCVSMDLAEGAKPTLEHEQDGSYTCTTCGHHWKPPPPTVDA